MGVFEVLYERADLARLVGRYTELKPSRRALAGRCPRHDHEDTNPSFHVYPEGRFFCYGCRSHGDVTDLWAAVKGYEPGMEASPGVPAWTCPRVVPAPQKEPNGAATRPPDSRRGWLMHTYKPTTLEDASAPFLSSSVPGDRGGEERELEGSTARTGRTAVAEQERAAAWLAGLPSRSRSDPKGASQDRGGLGGDRVPAGEPPTRCLSGDGTQAGGGAGGGAGVPRGRAPPAVSGGRGVGAPQPPE